MPKLALSPAEKEMKLVRDSPLLWALMLVKRAWGWTNMDDWQRELFLCNDRYVFVDASRQSGKSHILALKAFRTVLINADALALIIAEQRQSNEDMRLVKQLAKAYDVYLREKYDGLVTLNPISDNVTSMELPNNSRVIALPANEKIRGFSAPTLVEIDEAGYVPDPVFVAVDPMMTVSQGQFILASTPNGTGGFYYTESKNPRYTKFVVPWHLCPRISREDIEQKRMIYGEAYVKQEYECEFLDEVAALFTERSLRESVIEDEDVLSEEMARIHQQIFSDMI